MILASAPCSADEALDARIAEAVKLVKQAVGPAPIPRNAVARTCVALDTLAKHRPEGLAESALSIASEPREQQQLRERALQVLRRTIELERLKKLLLRRELAEHAYFGIRSDVCCGLSSLRVRDRRALEILCKLMTDADPADKGLVVPLEAWLGFWILTGRTHGVADPKVFETRPRAPPDGKQLRSYIFAFSWSRPGVESKMVKAVERHLYLNSKEFEAARAKRKRVRPMRDTRALRDAADASRAEIDDILAEWAN